MFKDIYTEMNAQVKPDAALLASINTSEKQPKRRTPFYMRPVFAGVALLLCLSLSIPVLAANVPYVNQLVYDISPGAARFLRPIQNVCIDNGIQIELSSIAVNTNFATMIVKLQDLEGSRIDETTDLFDSYSINLQSGYFSSCKQVRFDEETKVASFVINIKDFDLDSLNSGSIWLSFSGFISGKQEYADFPVSLDMDTIANEPDTMILSDELGYGYSGDYDMAALGMPQLLQPSILTDFGIDGISISSAGYIGDKLHIQVYTGNNQKNDNHGYLYFESDDGDRIDCDYSFGFSQVKNDIYNSYTEYVFNLSDTELETSALLGYFVTSDEVIEGYWQIEVPLEAVPEGYSTAIIF